MRRSCRGFTLLELIVAFTILGLVAAIVFSSLRLALSSYEKSQERIDHEARERVLLDQIRRQLGSLFPLQPSLSMYDAGAGGMAGDGTVPDALLYSQIPLFQGTPDTVTFVTVAPLLLHDHPGLTVVRYGLSQDEYGDEYLGAMEGRYVGIDSFLAMAQEPPGKPLPLVKPIEDLAFEYYGFDAQSRTYNWYPQWSAEEMQTAPMAVRISFDERYILVPVNAFYSGTSVQSGIQNLLRQ